MLKHIIIAAAFAIGTPALAQPQDSAAQAQSQGETVTVSVNGLVCDFCAQSIQKVFKKRDAVQSVNVDLDNGLVTIVMKPGQTLDDDTVTKLIRDGGYSVTEIERTQA